MCGSGPQFITNCQTVDCLSTKPDTNLLPVQSENPWQNFLIYFDELLEKVMIIQAKNLNFLDNSE